MLSLCYPYLSLFVFICHYLSLFVPMLYCRNIVVILLLYCRYIFAIFSLFVIILFYHYFVIIMSLYCHYFVVVILFISVTTVVLISNTVITLFPSWQINCPYNYHYPRHYQPLITVNMIVTLNDVITIIISLLISFINI